MKVEGLSGARRLTVVADFGESFQTGATVVLADAMLLRAE